MTNAGDEVEIVGLRSKSKKGQEIPPFFVIRLSRLYMFRPASRNFWRRFFTSVFPSYRESSSSDFSM